MLADGGQIALSELIGALSYALDIAEGEPPGHAKRACLIGMRLADQVGFAAEARSDLFYALLLKDAGCSANSAHMAALFGADDQHAKWTAKRVDWARALPALVWSLRTVAPNGSLRDRVGRLRAIRNEGQVTRSLMQARCDRGAEIARKLGFSRRTAEAIRALDEHWDGRGQPRGLRGDEISPEARILCLAQTVEVFHADQGVDAACRVAVKRSGQWFDPTLIDALLAMRGDGSFWGSLAEPDLSTVSPPDQVELADERRLEGIAEAFSKIVDAKSPWTYRHSERVHTVATGIAVRLGLEPRALWDLGHASRLHDIGKLAISNRILDKLGPLTDDEYATVKRHPLVTEEILGRVPGFSEIARLASAHHERLDGRGYPRGLAAGDLTMPMRVLAVADVYEALTESRPYRAPWPPERALELMRLDVPRRLDRDAFAALESLLETAGEKTAVTAFPARGQDGADA